MSEKSLREQLVGAWALTSCVERDIETGVETHPLGERPLGLILYTALAFYGSIGKKPIHIQRVVKGHLANRLQAALWREAFYLVEQGIASVGDVDTAIAYGPGLRWALLGPFLNLHLSGGADGIAHVLEHLGPPMESSWRDLGNITLNEELNLAIARGVTEELGGVDLADLTSQRDDALLALLRLKADADRLP